MRSRAVREGSTGLLILGGIALFVALGVWLRGATLGNRGYRVVVQFENARGLKQGTNVRYRGVTVGRVNRIRPTSVGVDVELQITAGDVMIPVESDIQTNQSGLIGEAFLDITPRKPIDEPSLARPLDPKCDPTIVICNNSRVQGRSGSSIDELIRVATRLVNQVSDPELFDSLKAATKNTADAAAAVTRLADNVSEVATTARREIVAFSSTAQTTALSFSRAADQISLTAAQVNNLLAINRNSVITILDNLAQTSNQLRVMANNIVPLTERLEKGELMTNLENLTASASRAAANLRDISGTLNSPENLLLIQQTLDSARSTFQNVQKITSDLDELTGDPALRQNIRNLIKGLSTLVSNAEQLQNQAQLAQVLTPLAEQMSSQPPAATMPPQPVLQPPSPATASLRLTPTGTPLRSPAAQP